MKVRTVKLGKNRWTLVTCYGDRSPGRTGCWCEDAAGGWGVGPTAEKAIKQCYRPRTYKTKREAEREAELRREYL